MLAWMRRLACWPGCADLDDGVGVGRKFDSIEHAARAELAAVDTCMAEMIRQVGHITAPPTHMHACVVGLVSWAACPSSYFLR